MGPFKKFLQQNGGINLLKNLTVSDTRWLMSEYNMFFDTDSKTVDNTETQ